MNYTRRQSNGKVNLQKIQERLQTLFLQEAKQEQLQYTLWDSVHHTLHQKGLSVLRHANQWLWWDLTEWAPLGEPVVKRCSEKAPRFWQDFPPGEFSNQMKKEMGLWSLNPFASVQTGETSIKLLNKEEKTIANLLFIELPEDTIVKLSPLKGYKEETASALRILTEEGFSETGKSRDQKAFSFYPERNYLPAEVPLPSDDIPVRRAVNDKILVELHTARFFEEGIIQDLDTECLHSYRVSLRKIRSMLSLIKGIYPAEEEKKLKADIKKIQQVTNKLRDLDVFLMEEEEYKSLVPEDFQDNLTPLFQQAAQSRRNELRKVRASLKSGEYAGQMSELESYFERVYRISPTLLSSKPVGSMVRTRIKKLYRRITRDINAIDRNSPDEKIHELRIQGKKLRYMLDFFHRIIDPKAKKRVERSLKQLQNQLGKFNDLSVQMADLTEKSCDPHNKESRLAIGFLLGTLYHQSRIQRETVLEHLRDFLSEEIQESIAILTKSGRSE